MDFNQEFKQNKWIKVLEFVKEFFIPIIVFIFSLGVFFTNIDNKIASNTIAVEDITEEQNALVEEMKEIKAVQNEILQEQAATNAKLDYVIPLLEEVLGL